MQGDSKGGQASPFVSLRGVVPRRGTQSKVSPSWAAFWLLFVRTKSNPGHEGEAPEKFRKEICFSPTRPAIRESALHQPDAPAQKHQNRLEAPHAAMRQRTPSALMAGLMVSSLSMAMAEAARPARAVFSRSVPSR